MSQGLALPALAADAVLSELDAMQAAREPALAACRRAIRYAGSVVRAVHKQDAERAAQLLADCDRSLREAQAALRPFPVVAYAGFLQDAEKEYAEAALTRALVDGTELPTWTGLSIGLAPWLNGLCEAASELRREVLDRLREGASQRAQGLLEAMDGVYDLVVGVDYPDALTGGLRRSADALRAVVERTRSDLTTTLLQLRLQASLERASQHVAGPPGEGVP
jgi:translin